MLRHAGLSLLLLTLASGLCLAQKVEVDYDHGANFANFKTYSWAPSAAGAQVNQLMEQRIVSAVDEELAKKGLRRVESGGDVTVSYQAAVRQETQLTTYNTGYGPGWGWGWGASGISTTNATKIPVGTLVIDLTDPTARQLVFRAYATDTLSDKPEKNAKKLKKAIDKMFEKYPPKQQAPKVG